MFSALLVTMDPVKSGDWVNRVYDEATQRLSNHDTDAEVRECAEACIGDLWISATDLVKGKDRREWEAMCRTTGRTDGAVQVVTKVAREVEIGDDWVNGCIAWLLTLLRKSGRVGKSDMFACLDALLRRLVALDFDGSVLSDMFYRYKAGIPADLPPHLIPTLKSYITTSDISLLSQSLSIVALLLQLAPSTTFPEVEKELLKDIYDIAHSPLVSGAALDSVLAFFAALVEADGQIATHVIPNLVIAVEKAPKTEASPANVARCVGQVANSQRGVAAGTIVEFSKHLKVYSFACVSSDYLQSSTS